MKKVLKWIGIVLGSLIGLILLAGIVLFTIGNSRLNKVYDFEPIGQDRFCKPDLGQGRVRA